MLRERTPLFAGALVLTGALFGPAIARADELTVNLRETDNGVVVELRGMDGVAAPQQVITSKTGALLFLPEQRSPVRRIAAPPKHRLDFVQVGQAGKRVAVRIVQRKRANGSLGKFMRSEAVAGGLDVFIEDGVKPPPAPIVAVPPTVVDRDDATKAALAKLAAPEPGEPPAPMPAPAPVAPPEPPTLAAATIDVPETNASISRDDAPKHASAAFADESFADAATPPNGRTMGWIALASLCAFAGLAMWKLRKRRATGELEALRVVSRVALGPKQQILWIVAGDRALLVGATEHGITLISELGRVKTEVPVDIAPSAPRTQSDPNAGGKIAAFKQRLRVALGDELAGDADDRGMPAHLELLTQDPKWAQRKDTA
jgi:flagellar biogenesis protein FliO